MSSIFRMQLSTSKMLSFSSTLSSSNHLFLHTQLSSLSLNSPPPPSTVIRMGGGPRTFPGGVSKWQWKRMQAKKQKQLLKARLCRERQIYEMRKRAELKAAVSELERPWEPVERPPNLFSVSADEQVKVLADRFQRAGGFDLWTERDGPQIFESVHELPSARFFPKGVVHSVKPYGKISRSSDEESVESTQLVKDEDNKREVAGIGHNGKNRGRKLRKRIGSERKQRDEVGFGSNGDDRLKINSRESQVYEMNLQKDGSYDYRS